MSAKVAQWFDEHIKRNKGVYPFDSATDETGIKVAKTSYFSDIIIWENESAEKAFSYIEIKPPFGANEDMERFGKKAFALNVKVAYTWNFQNLNAYTLNNNKLELHD